MSMKKFDYISKDCVLAELQAQFPEAKQKLLEFPTPYDAGMYLDFATEVILGVASLQFRLSPVDQPNYDCRYDAGPFVNKWQLMVAAECEGEMSVNCYDWEIVQSAQYDDKQLDGQHPFDDDDLIRSLCDIYDWAIKKFIPSIANNLSSQTE